MVKDVEITAPHVCIVTKRPPEPMHFSRNAGKCPPGRVLSSSLQTTAGQGPDGHTEEEQLSARESYPHKRPLCRSRKRLKTLLVIQARSRSCGDALHLKQLYLQQLCAAALNQKSHITKRSFPEQGTGGSANSSAKNDSGLHFLCFLRTSEQGAGPTAGCWQPSGAGRHSAALGGTFLKVGVCH